MPKALALSGLFLFFILLGGLWVGLITLIPAGTPRAVVVVALGAAFAATFVGLLLSRVRKILAGGDGIWLHGAMVLLELALLIAGFAAMYRELGIIDTTQPGSPVVHDFWQSAYLSLVTFTTVGYGDFYPTGLGRALAALQGLTGYVVLGTLASTASSVVSPHNPAGPDDRAEE
jgi:hypothetical protein